jgi:hypothetical protein
MAEMPSLPDELVSETRKQMQITSSLGYYTVPKGLGVDTEALNKGLAIFQEQGGKRFAQTVKKALGLGESLAHAHKATLAAAQIFGWREKQKSLESAEW